MTDTLLTPALALRNFISASCLASPSHLENNVWYSVSSFCLVHSEEGLGRKDCPIFFCWHTVFQPNQTVSKYKFKSTLVIYYVLRLYYANIVPRKSEKKLRRELQERCQLLGIYWQLKNRYVTNCII